MSDPAQGRSTTFVDAKSGQKQRNWPPHLNVHLDAIARDASQLHEEQAPGLPDDSAGPKLP
jgi:hypothetical protein